jgi:hypothetical protein
MIDLENTFNGQRRALHGDGFGLTPLIYRPPPIPLQTQPSPPQPPAHSTTPQCFSPNPPPSGHPSRIPHACIRQACDLRPCSSADASLLGWGGVGWGEEANHHCDFISFHTSSFSFSSGSVSELATQVADDWCTFRVEFEVSVLEKPWFL